MDVFLGLYQTAAQGEAVSGFVIKPLDMYQERGNKASELGFYHRKTTFYLNNIYFISVSGSADPKLLATRRNNAEKTPRHMLI